MIGKIASSVISPRGIKPKIIHNVNILVCDGSCLGNPGPGGFAFGFWNTSSKSADIIANPNKNTTNNIMELTAIIEGIKAHSDSNIYAVYTDSNYAVRGANEWIRSWQTNSWLTTKKSPVKNKDLWIELDNILSVNKIQLNWIKGHARCEEGSDDFEMRLTRIQNMVDEHAKNTASTQVPTKIRVEIA